MNEKIIIETAKDDEASIKEWDDLRSDLDNLKKKYSFIKTWDMIIPDEARKQNTYLVHIDYAKHIKARSELDAFYEAHFNLMPKHATIERID